VQPQKAKKLTSIKSRLQFDHVYSRQQSLAIPYVVRYSKSLKVLISSADLKLYDIEFQTEEALTVNAFTGNASAMRFTESHNNIYDRNVLVGRLQ